MNNPDHLHVTGEYVWTAHPGSWWWIRITYSTDKAIAIGGSFRDSTAKCEVPLNLIN